MEWERFFQLTGAGAGIIALLWQIFAGFVTELIGTYGERSMRTIIERLLNQSNGIVMQINRLDKLVERVARLEDIVSHSTWGRGRL